MSESVRIGGIGKNPAIDKVNSLNAIDIKNYAADKMRQVVLNGYADSNIAYGKDIPVQLDRVDWEGGSGGGD